MTMHVPTLLPSTVQWTKSIIWQQSSTEMKLKMLLHEQGLFFIETSCNSANMAKKLAYVPLFWMDNAEKLLSLSYITQMSFRNE